MKIDWLKWSFTISDNWADDVTIHNSETGENIFVGSFRNIKYLDDPAKTIKETVKEKIEEVLTQRQIKEWRGKQISVEDNLDYIENEAEKRGLI
jgi:hypothetical protein